MITENRLRANLGCVNKCMVSMKFGLVTIGIPLSTVLEGIIQILRLREFSNSDDLISENVF